MAPVTETICQEMQAVHLNQSQVWTHLLILYYYNFTYFRIIVKITVKCSKKSIFKHYILLIYKTNFIIYAFK